MKKENEGKQSITFQASVSEARLLTAHAIVTGKSKTQILRELITSLENINASEKKQ